MISLRRMTLGSGYRYLMESIATGDGAVGTSSSLTRYYAARPELRLVSSSVLVSPPSTVAEESKRVHRPTEQHLLNLLGCAPTR